MAVQTTGRVKCHTDRALELLSYNFMFACVEPESMTHMDSISYWATSKLALHTAQSSDSVGISSYVSSTKRPVLVKRQMTVSQSFTY